PGRAAARRSRQGQPAPATIGSGGATKCGVQASSWRSKIRRTTPSRGFKDKNPAIARTTIGPPYRGHARLAREPRYRWRIRRLYDGNQQANACRNEAVLRI